MPDSSIRLLESESDLGRYLSPEDRAQADQVEFPTVELGPGPVKVSSTLRSRGAFAGMLARGMILQSSRLGDHAGLRLIGPGDIVSVTSALPSMLVLEDECRATVATEVVLLGREMLLAGRRWPWLIAGLHTRMAEQADRLATQLMICQLPRVDDRLLAMMWLLAESWGQVTPSGTLLPVELTHSALGGLVGARRPTVTLALSELTERGSVVRQADGWLLLQRPKTPAAGQGEAPGEPRPLTPIADAWTDPAGLGADERIVAAADADADVHARLHATVARLRLEHETRTEQLRERLDRLVASRKRAHEVRVRIRTNRTGPDH